MIFNIEMNGPDRTTLLDLAPGQTAIVEEFNLPTSVSDHLMNLGLVPGLRVRLAHVAPGGTPRVYRVDGSEFALRSDLSENIVVRPVSAEAGD